MAGTVEKRLTELGIVLPASAPPIANYVAFVRTGNFMVVSGQLCLDADGKLVAQGKLGAEVSIEDGQRAARACAINLLAQIKAGLGDLNKVVRVVCQKNRVATTALRDVAEVLHERGYPHHESSEHHGRDFCCRNSRYWISHRSAQRTPERERSKE